MTVSSTTSRKTFAGDGVTTSFDTSPVVFFDAEDLTVYVVTTATGVVLETLVLNTDYTVSGGAGSTGTLDLSAGSSPYGAPAVGTTLVIVRELDIVQEADLVNNDGSDAEVQEDALDRLTMIAQEISTRVGRSFVLADSDVSGASLTVPTPSGNKLIGWNSGATALENKTPADLDLAVVTAFVETLLDDPNAAAARATLDVPSNAEAILDTLIAAKGDLIVGTANDTPSILTVGANGTIPMARSASAAGIAYAAALNKAIYGLTYANNGLDATNDLDIAVGGAMDATGAYWMTLASALTKRSDAAWAVGTNQGALDSGAVGNNDYYIWLIARSDTGVVDVLFSLSSTAPTMPTNYDFKRLIGWFKRVGGTIVAFDVYETDGGGIELLWDAPTLDISLANTLTTTRRTDAVKVPLNFSTIAILNVVLGDGASNYAWIYCPDQADSAPSASAAPLTNINTDGASTHGGQLRVRTSATGTIAARCTTATMDSYLVSTIGFTWARRN